MNQNENKTKSKIWDVVVIGGGPAGMMSAIQAKKKGLDVLLLEKNSRLGEKLLITGGGRCNVTNEEYDNKKILAKFKGAENFLYSPFSQFAVKDALEFFHLRKMPTKTEALQRVFPATNRAESVWSVLVEELKKSKVEILYDSEVQGFIKVDGQITGVKMREDNIIYAKNFILATGGKSRPETGSTGDGFKWLKAIGHKVTEPTASLVPVAIRDNKENNWFKALQGITLPEVKITTVQFEKKQKVSKGKILFTHFGVTGPTILNMSKSIGELLSYGDVFIVLDLLPSLDHGMLNKKLQEIFAREHNKKIKNSLDELFVSALAPIVLEKAGIDIDKKCNSVTFDERMKLIEVAKNMKMEVLELLGTDKAIITSGGVDLKEVDTKTMQSKLFPNLFLVGDVLDIDRPSGGYSLQLCWTTGFVAGDNIKKI
ncbi:MAG: flavoprotein [Candidatus Taylorbacteria bacterium]|nr:flavoprotein [Candidatus Taylorbacteria bacterium]